MVSATRWGEIMQMELTNTNNDKDSKTNGAKNVTPSGEGEECITQNLTHC